MVSSTPTVTPESTEQHRRRVILDRLADHIATRLPQSEAELLQRFARVYYARVPIEDLEGTDIVDQFGAALSHWTFGQRREPGAARVRAFTPDPERSGWRSHHDVVEIVVDDMPFIIDSVTGVLQRRGLDVHLVISPTLAVVRDADGIATAVTDDRADEAGHRETFIHVELDRVPLPEALREIEQDLTAAIEDVAAAVGDWAAMRARVGDIAASLEGEALAFVEWLLGDHFTLLGCARFDTPAAEEPAQPVAGTALGILRRPGRLDRIEPPADTAEELHVSKGRERSSVSRPVHLDEIWVPRRDAPSGAQGWDLVTGLFGAAAYTGSVTAVPLLRQKVAAVLDRSGAAPGGHAYNRLQTALEQYPRDEVFQSSVDLLEVHAAAITELRDASRVRVLVRQDGRGRYYSCLVFLPRDQYTTELRLRVQAILAEEFGTDDFEYTALVSESPHARLHYVLHGPDPALTPTRAVLEERIRLVARDWSVALRGELIEVDGEARGIEEFAVFARAFSRGYREQYSARTAVVDIKRVLALPADDGMAVQLRQRPEDPPDLRRFKLYATGAEISLSRVMPILQNLGVDVLDERPHRVEPADRAPVWIYDFTLRLPALALAREDDTAHDRFEEAFSAVWRGEADDDPLNRLIVVAGFRNREVVLMRAFVHYLRQIGLRFSDDYIAEMLVEHVPVTAALIRLFERRHHPEHGDASLDLAADILAHIAEVESLEHDRLLRALLSVIMASVRTNYFQRGSDGSAREVIAFKLASRSIPEAPEPRPLFEVFVFASRVEGVHLRSGPVSRGGIRWSDRREDFRTEILGLMHTQTAKNAFIVPTGAKGGFIVRRPPADRPAFLQEGGACYRMLINALLDITDNIVAGKVIAPPHTIRYDGDDPYLVVAADKGTASFSDIADEISVQRGFWLGDAFASGGSVGYDHKAMGITARGAWESVQRHFRELGVDVQTEPITAVGVGDMSGDVFGNGMLLSRSLKLIAAFDHRHIFVDPDPDAAVSFEERTRLFALPASSWADYNAALISPGGLVVPRNAKSVILSPEARRALDVAGEEVTPDELITAILKAPVDLLWNGGIGTFVKSRFEAHADTGDRSNDAIRVDADALRCRVVGEGGNLGFTQAARIEYALAGGRIYTDFIDNSGGVDTSDREVNIKIVLDRAVAEGDLTEKQRVDLLRAMTDEIAAAVVLDNYAQTGALTNAFSQAHLMVDVHARQLARLESQIGLNRALEGLPPDDVLADRRAAGKGLQLPELSVLLAYTKLFVRGALIDSELTDDPWFAEEIAGYFPSLLRERFPRQIADHPLRRELVAAQAANHVVNYAGISMVHRMIDETSATVADIVRAHYAAWHLFDMAPLWDEIAALDLRVPARVQTEMFLECRRLAERSTRWLLRHRRSPLEVAPTIETFRPTARAVREALPTLLQGSAAEKRVGLIASLVAEGVPEATATRVGDLGEIVAVLDIVDQALRTDTPPERVAEVYFVLETRLGFAWLVERINALPRDDRWQSLARSALRDDLLAELARVTGDVATARSSEESAEMVYERWATHNAEPRARAQLVLDAVRGLGHAGLAPLNVALLEVRNLLHQSSLPAAGGS
ncbi:MAG: NAD-glutamate dehydrogenase [Dehalococcoidia bacterium]